MHNDDFASSDHYRVGNSKLHTANAISLQTLLSHGAAANQTHWKRHWGGSQYSYSFGPGNPFWIRHPFWIKYMCLGSKIYFGSENPFWILNSIFFPSRSILDQKSTLDYKSILDQKSILNPRFNFWIRNFDFELEIHFGSEIHFE